MGLLDRPDSTLLLVIMGVCIVGLLVLAAFTFFPGLSGRLRPGGPADAYPDEPVQLAARLNGFVSELDPLEPERVHEPETEMVTVLAAPAPAAKRRTARKPTSSTARKTTAKKTTTKTAPARRTATKKPSITPSR